MIGYAGRTIDDVYKTSIIEFEAIGQAIQEKTRETWEVARWLSFTNMQLSPFLKKKPTSPRAFCRFPWDDEIKYTAEVLTPAQEAELFRLIQLHDQKQAN